MLQEWERGHIDYTGGLGCGLGKLPGGGEAESKI